MFDAAALCKKANRDSAYASYCSCCNITVVRHGHYCACETRQYVCASCLVAAQKNRAA